MSKIKLTYNKVYNYVKGKPVAEVIAEVIAFGFLAPLAIGGIMFIIFGLVTGQVDVSNASFGIYG